METNDGKIKLEKEVIISIITTGINIMGTIISGFTGYLDVLWAFGILAWMVLGWTIWSVVLINPTYTNLKKYLSQIAIFVVVSTLILLFVGLWCNSKDNESTGGNNSSMITVVPSLTEPQKPTLTPTVPPTPTVVDTPTPTPTNTPILTATCTPTPAHIHDYTYIVSITNEPTCTSTGIQKNVCVCGAYREEIIPKLGHTEVIDEAVVATCTESGLTEGKRCSVCGTATVTQKEIDAKGHTYDTSMDIECNNCGYIRGYWGEWTDNGTVAISETDTRQVKTESVLVTTYQYRYNRYVWYNSEGVYSSSKQPRAGYTSGTVKKGSKTYSIDYSDWYDAPIEVVWKYYDGYSDATSTYDCDGTIYYNEEVKENTTSEIHYFYREVIYY